jgi:hypothetical protein
MFLGNKNYQSRSMLGNKNYVPHSALGYKMHLTHGANSNVQMGDSRMGISNASNSNQVARQPVLGSFHQHQKRDIHIEKRKPQNIEHNKFV